MVLAAAGTANSRQRLLWDDFFAVRRSVPLAKSFARQQRIAQKDEGISKENASLKNSTQQNSHHGRMSFPDLALPLFLPSTCELHFKWGWPVRLCGRGVANTWVLESNRIILVEVWTCESPPDAFARSNSSRMKSRHRLGWLFCGLKKTYAYVGWAPCEAGTWHIPSQQASASKVLRRAAKAPPTNVEESLKKMQVWKIQHSNTVTPVTVEESGRCLFQFWPCHWFGRQTTSCMGLPWPCVRDLLSMHGWIHENNSMRRADLCSSWRPRKLAGGSCQSDKSRINRMCKLRWMVCSLEKDFNLDVGQARPCEFKFL